MEKFVDKPSQETIKDTQTEAIRPSSDPQISQPEPEGEPKSEEERTTELFFNKVFFQQVWPKLLGRNPDLDVSSVLNGEPSKAATAPWESMAPALDAYVQKFNVPTAPGEGEDDERFFDRLVQHLYALNPSSEASKLNSWPSVAMKNGVTDCFLGAQVMGRVLQQSGYEVTFGTPGPLSHAVIFAKDKKSGTAFYIDSANGVVTPVVSEETIGGVKAFRIDPTSDDARTRIPFRLVPVLPLQESVRSSVMNLGNPKTEIKYDPTNPQLLKLVHDFEIEPQVQYGNWSVQHLSPIVENILNDPAWKTEANESGQRIKESRGKFSG